MQHSRFFSRPQALAAWFLAALLWAGGAGMAGAADTITIHWPFEDPAKPKEKQEFRKLEPLTMTGPKAVYSIWLEIPKGDEAIKKEGEVVRTYEPKFIYGFVRDKNGSTGEVTVTCMEKAQIDTGPAPKSLPGKLTIDKLTLGGGKQAEGALLDEKGVVLATFTVTQEAKLTVHFDGAAPTAGPLGLISKSPTLDQFPVFTVTAAGGEKLQGVKVRLDPFTSDLGAPSGVMWTLNNEVKDGEVSLSELGAADLKLKAESVAVGMHRSKLTVLQDGVPAVVKNVTLDRQAAPDVLEVLWTKDLRVTTGKEPCLTMTLRATNGAGLKLTGARLTKLARVDKDGAGSQGDIADPKPPPQPGADGKAVGKGVVLPANEMVKLSHKMLPQEPGEYDGVITLVTPGPQVKTADFKLYVRSPEWVAMLWIGCGVVAAGVIRFFVTIGIPRLRLRHRVAVLHENLTRLEKTLPGSVGPLEPEEAAMVASLSAGLAVLNRDLDPAKSAEAEAAIKTFQQKLTVVGEWIPARRNIRTLPPKPGGHPEIEGTVREMKAFLDDPRATEAAFTALELKMKNLNGEIEKAQIAHLAGLLLKQLDAMPVGFEDSAADWDKLKAVVRAKVEAINTTPLGDAGLARAGYQDAYSIYLKGVANRLSAVISGMEETWKPKAEAHAAAFAAFKQAAEPVKTKLAESLTKLGSGDLPGAGDAYLAAAKAYQTERPLPPPPPADALETVSAPETGRESMGVNGVTLASVQLPARVAHAVPPPPTVASVTWKLAWLNLLMAVAVGLIAVLMGVNFLWVKNPVWGGLPSYLEAFLWGLGLHSVTTFGGFKALEDSLIK